MSTIDRIVEKVKAQEFLPGYIRDRRTSTPPDECELDTATFKDVGGREYVLEYDTYTDKDTHRTISVLYGVYALPHQDQENLLLG